MRIILYRLQKIEEAMYFKIQHNYSEFKTRSMDERINEKKVSYCGPSQKSNHCRNTTNQIA